MTEPAAVAVWRAPGQSAQDVEMRRLYFWLNHRALIEALRAVIVKIWRRVIPAAKPRQRSLNIIAKHQNSVKMLLSKG